MAQSGAFHKAGFDLPKKQKEYEQFVRTPFHTSCSARYSVLHLLGVLSGGDEPPLCKGSLWFVRPESPSTFPDKHCICGHKSDAPREAGQNIILKLAIYFLLLVIFHRNASTQTEDFHPRNKGNRKPYYIRHYCRSAKNHISIHEPKEMYVRYS